MLQNKYKTNSLMRCKNFSFAIPLGSILALLFLMLLVFSLPWYNKNLSYAIETNSTFDASIPSASLSIANPKMSSTGEAGEVLTMNSDVTVNATLIDDYNLQISGNPILDGPTLINAITVASGIEDLADNTWGYSWNGGDYRGIDTTNTTIAKDGISNNGTVNYTSPLTFAAKFGKDASTGRYKTSVNLLLTATPKRLTVYTLGYDANGGNNAPSTQIVSSYEDVYDFTVAAQDNLNVAGGKFLGWTESANELEVTYTPGSNIQLSAEDSNKILYAVWGEEHTLLEGGCDDHYEYGAAMECYKFMPSPSAMPSCIIPRYFNGMQNNSEMSCNLILPNPNVHSVTGPYCELLGSNPPIFQPEIVGFSFWYISNNFSDNLYDSQPYNPGNTVTIKLGEEPQFLHAYLNQSGNNCSSR